MKIFRKIIDIIKGDFEPVAAIITVIVVLIIVFARVENKVYAGNKYSVSEPIAHSIDAPPICSFKYAAVKNAQKYLGSNSKNEESYAVYEITEWYQYEDMILIVTKGGDEYYSSSKNIVLFNE